MTLQHSLLALLSDGQFHPGPELGEKAGCSRSAVWKAIHSLQAQGVEIFSVRGKGYRLPSPVELLDEARIRSGMSDTSRQRLQGLDVLLQAPSTNAVLLERVRHGHARVEACFAEYQTAGRGRRGRTWQSPFGGNIYCSLLWPFATGASRLAGLSLATAVAIGRALRECGLGSYSLKWPNDILVDGRKLAGVLLEVVGEASGPCAVIIGVGINVRTPASRMEGVDQPWVDLETASGSAVDRNRLAGQVLGHMIDALMAFEHNGLTPFVDEWNRHDMFLGREVELLVGSDSIIGVAQGIDQAGALILAHDGGREHFFSGEASLRAAR